MTSQLDVSPVLLKVDQPIPCGLILNEVVTNALKCAYPKGCAGEVTVELAETPAGEIRLRISDQGVGLPKGLNWKKVKSLGLRIVSVLAEQLGATLTIDSEPGVTVSLTIPNSGFRQSPS